MEIDKGIAELESPIKPSLSESLRLTLYRVAEEALSNAAKHSQAKAARVSVSLSPAQEVLLEVEDDGQGFDPSAVSRGQGVISMEDYVSALGGTLEMRSARGMGTTIRATVPVASAERQVVGAPS